MVNGSQNMAHLHLGNRKCPIDSDGAISDGAVGAENASAYHQDSLFWPGLVHRRFRRIIVRIVSAFQVLSFFAANASEKTESG
jgi:hypothetical protein